MIFWYTLNMFLAELNTFDPRLEEKHVFVVSLGALEQHGPYAPLGTDDFVQDALIRQVEAEVPDVIFLPNIPIGPSWQQMGFRGSISLQEPTLYALLRDMVESLRDGASMMIFVSWHGGNKPVIEEFIQKESAAYPDVRLEQITFGDEGTDVPTEKLLNGPPDDHAGNTEVSLMLAIRPDITKQPKTNDPKQPLEFAWDKRIIDVQADGVVDEHPSWVATKKIGDELFKIYTKNLVAKIKKLQVN
jgi:creatinine amidohydrolase/Fe(II)-dependent formamide hydrolase-like protein